MELNLINIQGENKGTITGSDSVFNNIVRQGVIAQYLRVFSANARQGTASTKDRAEVSGGGKKPWKQKGTGRARHGSIRSPIWVGGGVTHGPKPKSWNLDLPKKMRRLAIVSILSLKASNDTIKVVESFDMDSIKTKNLAVNLDKVSQDAKKVLIVTKENNLNIRRSASNLQNVKVSMVQNLNGFDLLNSNLVLLEKEALDYLNNKYNQITR